MCLLQFYKRFYNLQYVNAGINTLFCTGSNLIASVTKELHRHIHHFVQKHLLVCDPLATCIRVPKFQRNQMPQTYPYNGHKRFL
jgi:hypothetical protein